MESGPNRTSATARRVGRRAGIGAVVAAALLTSACAAGQRAETAEEKPTLDGTEANIGTMQLRGLAIEAPVVHPYYPEGADAQITVVLVNTATSTDRLTGISSPSFSSWSAYDSLEDADAVQGADDPLADQSSSSASPSDSAGSSSSSSGSSSSSSSSSASSSSASSSSSGSSAAAASSSAPTGTRSVAIESNSRVGFGTPEATGGLLVMKFTRAVYPGNSVQITFTFAKAGSKTITVPVQITNGPNESVIPSEATTSGAG